MSERYDPKDPHRNCRDTIRQLTEELAGQRRPAIRVEAVAADGTRHVLCTRRILVGADVLIVEVDR